MSIDIITVWYNREDLVEESIGSLLNQSANNFSILAVDDGSTDETANKLDEMSFKARKKNIDMRVWKKKNEGLTSSLKQAIEIKTNKDIIAIHGAGDISHQTRIEKQYNYLLTDNKLAVVGCKVGVDNRISGRKYFMKVADRPVKNLTKLSIPRPGAHGAAMFYRSIYLKCGGYRDIFQYGQDTDLWLRMIEYGLVGNLQEVLYTQVITESNVSVNFGKIVQQKACTTLAIQSAIAKDNNQIDPVSMVNNFSDIWKLVDKSLMLKRIKILGCPCGSGNPLYKCCMNKNFNSLMCPCGSRDKFHKCCGK